MQTQPPNAAPMVPPPDDGSDQPPATPGAAALPAPAEAPAPGPASDINLDIAAELLVRARIAAAAAHRIHLTTPNDAAHRALADWYDAVVEHADRIAEVAQGVALGQPLPFTMMQVPDERNPVSLLVVFNQWVQANRAALSPLPEVQALVDDLRNLTHQTLYKLTRLT